MRRIHARRFAAAIMLAFFLALFSVQGHASGATASGAPEELTYQQLVDRIKNSSSKVVLLNFWATWCGPCRQEIPEIKAIRDAYPQESLEIIAVSVDQDPYDVERFSKIAKFNYPIYRGAIEVATGFGVNAIPRTMLYDAHRKQVFSHEGFMDGALLRAEIEKYITK